MTTLIYLWGILPSIIGFFVFATIVFVAFAIYNFWVSMDKRDSVKYCGHYEEDKKKKYLDDSKEYLGKAKKMISLSVISAVIVTLIPNKETFAAMIIIPEIAKSDVLKKDVPEIYDMAIKKLKAELGGE